MIKISLVLSALIFNNFQPSSFTQYHVQTYGSPFLLKGGGKNMR